MALRRRLLQDIAELQTDPYPNIILHPIDLEEACLLLTPVGKEPLHLTIAFGAKYPLKAPRISMNSKIEHPNVFGSYICASILNTEEGYTPAYTLKGIAIQLLSFFSSERLEQEGGGYQDLGNYGGNRRPTLGEQLSSCIVKNSHFACHKCGFGGTPIKDSGLVIVGKKTLPDPFKHNIGNHYTKTRGRKQRPDSGNAPISCSKKGISSKAMPAPDVRKASGEEHRVRFGAAEATKQDEDVVMTDAPNQGNGMSNLASTTSDGQTLLDRLLALPDEIKMLVIQELDSKDMLAIASVSKRLADFMTSYDTIRMRELQCFCFKESFLNAKLGIGVSVEGRGRTRMLGSEFDLLSEKAFYTHRVRKSIQGIPFSYWLPLPLAHRHWRSVREDANKELGKLAQSVGGSTSNIKVLYSFMNDVVVKLSREAEQNWSPDNLKSTLTHASEKAVNSYFSLFHLLLCLATEQPHIVQDANALLSRFMQGHTNKDECPNLGQLMVAVLISDDGLTQDLAIAIIKEAVLRNVVWMLDPGRGKGMVDLVYTEPTPVSIYRLQNTFDASKTSYRLLMFLALFSRCARQPGKSIQQICNEMFERHGAPPAGTAESMAAGIRLIRNVSGFEEFFVMMGLEHVPEKEDWCTFLKSTIDGSVRAGYSRHALSQEKALAIRKLKDPFVEVKKGMNRNVKAPEVDKVSFFPGKTKKDGSRR